MFELILKSKSFPIPSDFPCIDDVNYTIYQTLKHKKKYEVKSNVSEDTMQSFVNNWINQEFPDINKSNISEYSKLSQEFDRLKDVIQLYKKIESRTINSTLIHKNNKLKKQIEQKQEKIERKRTKFQQINEILFRKELFASSPLYISKRTKLFYSCISENVNFVNFLTRQEIESENGLIYILNEDDMTAGLYGSRSAQLDLFVPRSIEYEGREFIIDRILERSFKKCNKIRSIQFSKNSEIKIIEKDAFSHSSLVEIDIPSSVIELGKRSFFFCKKLNEVLFQNGSQLRFISKEAFAYSSLMAIEVPSTVTHIGKRCFSICNQLREVSFPHNSELLSIDKSAFSNSGIQSISLPSHLTEISEYAFSDCNSLRYVRFSRSSELKVINKYAFMNSSVEDILIPPSVVELSGGWSAGLKSLTNIEVMNGSTHYKYYNDGFVLGKSDPNSFCFDVLIVAKKDIETVTIPSFVKRIEANAFDGCERLKTVNFAYPSELTSIGEFAFGSTSIQSIEIPQNVVEATRSFAPSKKLNQFLVASNNPNFLYLDSTYLIGKSDQSSSVYDVLHFARRDITKAVITTFIRRIESYAFEACDKLTAVEFPENSELVSIGKNAFSSTSIRNVTLPPRVAEIGNFCFSFSVRLQTVNFGENSQLRKIKKYAFFCTNLDDVQLPSHVKEIGVGSFSYCRNLKKVGVEFDSELKVIKSHAFFNTEIESLSIPSSVVDLEEGWCENVHKLNTVSVMGKNDHFISFGNDFVLGKSNDLSNDFDVLYFVRRNIRAVDVPPFIRKIAPYAFHDCYKIKSIRFCENSQLEIIDKFAFSNCSISLISIPPRVNYIGKFAFKACVVLMIVEIHEDSELISINTNSFYLSPPIIMVPSNLHESLIFMME